MKLPDLLCLLGTICALSLLGGCDPDPEDPGECGRGESVQVDGAIYCLYSSELIIEGFACPQDLSATQVPGGMVCGPQGMPLPAELEMPFECEGQGWCIDEPDNVQNNTMSPANNLTSPPNNTPQGLFAPPQGAVEYANLVVYDGAACAFDELGMVCWGEDTGERISDAPTGMGMLSVALGDELGCGIESEQKRLICWGSAKEWRAPEQGFASVQFIKEAGAMAALNPGDEPRFFNALGEGNEEILGMTFASMLGMVLFDTLDMRSTDPSHSETVCGLFNDGALYCQKDAVIIEDSRAYRQVFQDGLSQACALSTAGKVRCWDLDAGTQKFELEGTFKDLYSPYCGLDALSDVVCWGHEAQQLSQVVLIKRGVAHPEAFAMDYVPGTADDAWCELQQITREVRCSLEQEK